jgi:uncharacterized protein (TIGR04255 family)
MPVAPNARPPALPDFDDPPLDEVAVAVQFKELSRFLSIHYGLIYSAFSANFPRYEEHPPIPPRFELFGRSIEPSQGLELQTKPPLRRIWFVSEDGHRLIQLQPNSFIHNWRKVGGAGAYPRFEEILPTFFDNLDLIRGFVSDAGIGRIEINQCELSYFNNIHTLERETIDQAFTRVFRGWNVPHFPALKLSTLEPEAPRFALVLRVLQGAESIGRVHIDASPAIHTETGKPLIRLTLVARGRPCSTDNSGLQEFFLLAREAIVKCFALVTTDDCHALWRRQR